VEALRWNASKGLELLDKLGAVRVLPHERREKEAVAQYLTWSKAPNRKGQRAKVLAVASTWAEIGRFTSELRSELKSRGTLKRGLSIDSLKALHWTEAERRSVQLYQAGQVLVFHRPTKNMLWGGFAKNEAVVVEGADKEQLFVQRRNGKRATVTKKQAKCFGVFERQTIEVSAGDRLLLQANHRPPRRTALQGLADTLVGRTPFRARNGEIVEVKNVTHRRGIELTDGRTIPREYRQLTYGYAVTAHASQGKTVDRVLVMGDQMRKEHFYVAATRAREDVAVFTSDASRFLTSIEESTDRRSAIELERERARRAPYEREIERSTAQSESSAISAGW
jgi:hypothetical protein